MCINTHVLVLINQYSTGLLSVTLLTEKPNCTKLRLSCHQLLALPENIRLGYRGSSGANTVAYLTGNVGRNKGKKFFLNMETRHKSRSTDGGSRLPHMCDLCNRTFARWKSFSSLQTCQAKKLECSTLAGPCSLFQCLHVNQGTYPKGECLKGAFTRKH